MKVINSKELGEMFDDKADPGEFFDFDSEEDYRSPCWEVKIAREIGSVLFLVDRKEVLRAKLEMFKSEDLNSVDYLARFIQMLKEGDIDGLRAELKG
jgi:hypothetical protein